jgi:hypothetical protein
MDLIAASVKTEGGIHVHGWEDVSLVENETAAAPVVMSTSQFSGGMSLVPTSVIKISF